jgi:hypothetical protein
MKVKVKMTGEAHSGRGRGGAVGGEGQLRASGCKGNTTTTTTTLVFSNRR